MTEVKNNLCFTENDIIYHYLLKYLIKSTNLTPKTIDNKLANFLKIILEFDSGLMDINFRCDNICDKKHNNFTDISITMIFYKELTKKFYEKFSKYNKEYMKDRIYLIFKLNKYNISQIYLSVSYKHYNNLFPMKNKKKCTYFNIEYISKKYEINKKKTRENKYDNNFIDYFNKKSHLCKKYRKKILKYKTIEGILGEKKLKLKLVPSYKPNKNTSIWTFGDA